MNTDWCPPGDDAALEAATMSRAKPRRGCGYFPRTRMLRPLTDLELAVLTELRRMARENEPEARSASAVGLSNAGVGGSNVEVYRALERLQRRVVLPFGGFDAMVPGTCKPKCSTTRRRGLVATSTGCGWRRWVAVAVE